MTSDHSTDSPAPDCDRAIDKLLSIMCALRDPETGCPWDQEQTSASIARYTLEEAYEVVDAIERNDIDDIKDELGDLLLQVVFHSRIAEEAGQFCFDDVARAIANKMLRRHPHVFGTDGKGNNKVVFDDREAMKQAWEQHKALERKQRLQQSDEAARDADNAAPSVSALDGVPVAMPALPRAFKIQKRAASAGFDWDAVAPVLAKVREETDEVEDAISDRDQSAVEDEIGDLLFSIVNLARHCQVDAEQALRGATEKFQQRFRHMENELRLQNGLIETASAEQLDSAWNKAKRHLSDSP